MMSEKTKTRVKAGTTKVAQKRPTTKPEPKSKPRRNPDLPESFYTGPRGRSTGKNGDYPCY